MAKRPDIPFSAIAQQALLSSESLVSQWLPAGKKAGPEYKARNPLRSDNKTGSFSVNLHSGKWADFATSDAGNDLISLYAYLQGLEQWEAAIEVADLIGFSLPEGCRPDSKPESERKAPVIDPASVKDKKPKAESSWHPIMPIPANAIEPPKAHPKRGLPERTWAYRDPEGFVLSYLYRFKKSDGGKETIPLTWCKNLDTGAEEWRWNSMPVPRPLYGLDRIAAKPKAWVLLVSGEKCADAPVDLLPNAVIVTWPGGDNAIEKVDWSPLAGRSIFAWPDCDAQREKLTKAEKEAGLDPDSKPLLSEELQSGMKAMLGIRELMYANGLAPAKFKIVDIPMPGQKESGWDIADAIDEGMDGPALINMIKQTRPDIDVLPPADEPTKKNSRTANAEKSEGSGLDDWRDALVWSKKDLVDCRENVFAFLNGHPDLKGMLGHDAFANSMVKRKPAPWDRIWKEGDEWSDNDNLELSLWLSQREGFLVRSIDTINNAAKLVASRNKFNPVIEYYESVQWDGVTRLEHWLEKFAGVKDSPYSRLVGTFFMISLVARVYEPGCIMRAMPVFEGAQFRGKSSLLRIIGGRWFSDSQLDLKGKDGFINIQGILLYEIAELGSFNNNDANIIKAYISSATDRFRSPFDKYAKQYPRQTVMAGTTNEHEYLKDKTGNTRFWPLTIEEVGNIDLDGLAKARDQLFAEAVHRYKAGERRHPSPEEQLEFFTPEQTMRETEDPWETIIKDYLNLLNANDTTVAHILRDCLKVEPSKMTAYMASQVGKIMNRLGWKQSRPTAASGEKRARHYMRPEHEVQAAAASSTLSEPQEDDIPF